MLNLQKFRPIVARVVSIRSLSSTTTNNVSTIKSTNYDVSTNNVSTKCLLKHRTTSNVVEPFRRFSTKNVRTSKNDVVEDEAPKKILVEQNFKVPSFGGTLVFRTPVNVQVKLNLLREPSRFWERECHLFVILDLFRFIYIYLDLSFVLFLIESEV
jgi:hypothetical protein